MPCTKKPFPKSSETALNVNLKNYGYKPANYFPDRLNQGISDMKYDLTGYCTSVIIYK